MSKASIAKAAKKAARQVAAAYKSSLKHTGYGAAIAEKASREAERKLGAAFGAAMAKSAPSERDLGASFGAAMAKGRSPRKPLTTAEKKARARVLKAHKANASRAARLPGGKKGKKGKTGKTAGKKPSKKPTTRPTSKKNLPTVTANQVLAAASTNALKRWACEGARRSGCGAGGSRVVTATGTFKRLRPPRFMTGG